MADVIHMFEPYAEVPELVNAEAEQALLGTILMDPRRIARLPPDFSADHLYDPWHQEIMRALIALSASGEPNVHSVMEYLRGTEVDAKYLASLLAAAMIAAQVPDYAKIITNLWRRREMVRIAETLAQQARAPGRDTDPQATSALAMSELDALGIALTNQKTMFGLAEAADEALERARAAAEGKISGTTTGYRSLNEAMGYLEPGCLYVLAGRPGMGKTALALGMALGIAQTGAKVFYDSLEMQAAQLGRRALSLVSGVPQFVIKGGRYSDRDFQAISRARATFDRLSLSIDQQAGVNTAMVGLKARAAKRRMEGLDAIFVDHMHIVTTDTQAERNGAARAVEKISNDLKRLAVDMDVPVVALAQLNRSVEGREDKRPSMADLRQSGAIEQDADGIMFVYRGEYYLPKSEPEKGIGQTDTAHQKAVNDWHNAKSALAGKVEIIISKLREGEPCTVPMRFDAARTAFGDIE
ncbi:MAG: AAA family ATPase [Rhodospirillales bacterium]|nr:AAA family ATPase [Rhodospirillales bacterium]